MHFIPLNIYIGPRLSPFPPSLIPATLLLPPFVPPSLPPSLSSLLSAYQPSSHPSARPPSLPRVAVIASLSSASRRLLGSSPVKGEPRCFSPFHSFLVSRSSHMCLRCSVYVFPDSPARLWSVDASSLMLRKSARTLPHALFICRILYLILSPFVVLFFIIIKEPQYSNEA